MKKGKRSDLLSLLAQSNSQLSERAKSIRSRAAKVLGYVPQTFKEFTPHDIEHSDRIIGILDWFIPDKVRKNLSPTELFLLIAACYLHDIGMAVREAERKAIRKDPAFKTYRELRKRRTPKEPVDHSVMHWLRTRHHELSEKYILDHYVDLGFEKEEDEHARCCGVILPRTRVGSEGHYRK